MKRILQLIPLLLGATMFANAQPGDRLLKRLDTDGDGAVSLAEFQDGEVPHRMNFFDIDEEGLTLDEVTAKIDERIAERQARMSEKSEKMRETVIRNFQESDQDGDGLVSREEARASAFSGFDTDGDGYITRKELREIKWRRGRGGPHRIRWDD